jgi:hypothetical protein
MKKILGYITSYFGQIDKRVLVLSALLASICIFINYYSGLNHRINTLNETAQYVSWFAIFFLAFALPYSFAAILLKLPLFKQQAFLILLVIAPAIFAWKMSAPVVFELPESTVYDTYWNDVLYWPAKLIVVATALIIIWLLFDKKQQPFYGISTKNFHPRPYFLMLLIMVPLIAAASTQADFLAVYPKLHNINYLPQHQNTGWHKLLYELAYGSDFITIELFFRGFLVLAFVKFADKNAILPMAVFYCTIHFGKPLGECISSFFGGMLLGIITYNTRSIFGGLMVHLGIAWMMELGGYLAQ